MYLQLQGRIVNSLYHISRLKLISPIASHWQGDGPYQMARSCQCAAFVTWSLADCLFILQKTLWCGAEGGRRLALCWILSAGRQSQASTHDGGFGLLRPHLRLPCATAAAALFLHRILCVIMYLRNCISPWLPANILSEPESNIDTAYSYKWKKCLQKLWA